MPSSPDIVFIHGMWGSGRVASPLRKFLERRGHVVHCPTLPAHRSDTRSRVDHLSLQDYVDAICGYIDSRDFEQPPILIGHSMGGLIAQMIASQRECGPIVLLASAGPAGVNHICYGSFRTTWRILLTPFFWKKSHKPDWESARYGLLNCVEEDRARELWESFRPESGRALGELVFWFCDFTRTSRLPFRPRVPTLIISGNKDVITPPPVARALKKLYPHAELAEFPENGHWMIEEPGRQKIFERIASWIDGFAKPERKRSAHHGLTTDILAGKETSEPTNLPSPQLPSRKSLGNRPALDRSNDLRESAHGSSSAE